MGIEDKLKVLGLKKAYDFLAKDPVKNTPKVINMAKEFTGGKFMNGHLSAIENIFNEPNGNWNKFFLSLFEDIDEGQMKVAFNNWAINASVMGLKKQKEMSQKHNCNVPWAILMDPTSACNLKCIGCWASEYGNKLNMDLETLDSIITQGKELGTYFYIYSGGEPLVRKKDIITLCEMHSDCMFLSFTNGLLIDEEFADEMLRVKNFVPAISVEGYEEATDSRRGAGTFQGIMRAMKLLKERKLLFGISSCYTSKNCEVIGSEEYFDSMIEWGAKFLWLFTYMPVGNDAVPELMVSAEQRRFMLEKIRDFRQTKPLFTLDFWNDGEFVKGCIAGGKSYLHINANGDIEPCAFIHYADRNIKTSTLLEAYKAPLFQAYRAGQPFNENHLRPCPLLDNPDKLRKIVKNSGARSTDMISPENVDDLAGKCDDAAAKWAEMTEKFWDAEKGCTDMDRCRACAGCMDK
ncbi:MAG: radical SAM protein [Oscillospiraceae bacterium]|nr:radical SAM protein [Oscillospiraceae bacterium]